MASGRLGANVLSATTNTTVYTVPASKVAVITASICNGTTTSATVRLAHASTTTPAAEEYLEYGAVIPPGGVLERSGIVMDAAKVLVAYSDVANVNVVVFGYEEAA